MHLILYGPPGVGKGTQAQILKTKYNIPHISTGDILRQAVNDGTELGKRAKKYMDEGKLVPDDVMIGIIREILQCKECERGFILDGFPRTLAQAKALDAVFDQLGIKLDAVIDFEVDEDEIVNRLSRRWTCRSCKNVFNELINDLSRNESCPICGGELYQREDDRPEVVRHRLHVYKESTLPVREYYRTKGLHRSINGTGEVMDVHQRIVEHIDR